jgi:hydrogenase nickel incorporation protein HypA/HybF
MHELPVTESILEIALRHARQVNATRVTDLYLVIGKLSSIVDDSIQFYWDIIAKDTIAEGAQLHFSRVPAELECTTCGTKFHPDGEDFSCPSCRSNAVRVSAGEEFYLQAIDVENQETSGPESAQYDSSKRSP